MSVDAASAAGTGPVIAQGVDDEPMAPNQRDPRAGTGVLIAVLCAAYTLFHLFVMVVYPLETWTYRMMHVCGGLIIGFLTYSALMQRSDSATACHSCGVSQSVISSGS